MMTLYSRPLKFWLPVIVMSLFGLLLIYSSWHLYKMQERDIIQSSVEEVRFSMSSLKRALEIGNPQFVQQFLRDMAQAPEFNLLAVLDQSGNIVMATPEKWVNFPLSEAIPKEDSIPPSLSLIQPPPKILIEIDDFRVRAWYPLESGVKYDDISSGLMTSLYMDYDISIDSSILINQVLKECRVLFLLFILGMVLLVLLLRTMVSRPMRILSEATERLTDGDVGIQIKYTGAGEMADLAKSFNIMSARLAEQIKELRSNRKHYQSLVENTTDWIWEVNQAAVYTYVSPRCRELLGYEPEEILGKKPFDLMSSEEAERVAVEYRQILNQHRSFSGLENTNLHKKGYPVVLETSGVPFFDDQGRFLGYRGIDRDISLRRKAEQALKVTEQRYRTLIDYAPEALVILELGTMGFTDANDNALHLFGVDRKTLLKQNGTESCFSESKAKTGFIAETRKHLAEISTGKQVVFEWLHPDTEGSMTPFEVRMIRLPSASGDKQVRGSLLDISARRLAEAREASLGRIINDSLNEIYIFDAETLKFIEVNRGARENLGYSQEEMCELTPLDVKPEYDYSSFSNLVASLKNHDKEIIHFETFHKRKDGSYYDVEVHLQLIQFRGKDAFVAIIMDISERKKSEMALLESEKNLSITLNAIGDAVMVIDRDRKIVRMNPVAEQLTGWPFEAAQFQPLDKVFKIFDEQTKAKIPNPVETVFEKGEVVGLTSHVTLVTRDGDSFQITDSAAPIIDSGKTIMGVVLVFHDITEQYRIQKALSESHDRFSAFTSAMPDCGFIFDEDGRYLEIYGSEESLLYLPATKLRGKLIHDVLPASMAGLILETIRSTLESGKMQVLEFELSVPAGQRLFEGRTAMIKTIPGEKRKIVWLSRDMSERKQMENNLRANEMQMKEAQRVAQLGSWELDIKKNHLKLSDEIYRIFEIDRDSFKDTYEEFIRLVHPEDREMFNRIYRASIKHLSNYDIEHRLKMKDGRIKYVHEKGRTFFNGNGRSLRSLGTIQDITDRKLAEKKLEESEKRFRQLFEQMPNIAMQGYDAQRRIIFWNKASERLYGFTKQEVTGKKLEETIIPEPMIEEVKRLIHDFLQHGQQIPTSELELLRKDGSTVPVLSSHIKLKNLDGEYEMYCIDIDLTESKCAQAKIEKLAYFDSLTGLPNRRLFLDRLNQERVVAVRHENYGSVLFLDLDHFKTLNDALGHPFGDILLKLVGKRMSEQLRADDTVARLGGDEFVVLLKDLGKNKIPAAKQTLRIAEKIRSALCLPYQIEHHEHVITTSIGISMFPVDGESANTILKQADTAMYRAKESGRNTIRFYHPSMQEAADARLLMEKELRFALKNKELDLYYQPQVNTAGQVVGAEALLRWNHPTRGLIYPLEFIRVAEETGLIIPIGDWVANEACKQLKNWEAQSLTSNFHLAINVSPRQFRVKGFVSRIKEIIEATGIKPEQLTLELTENVVIDKIHEAIEKMLDLKKIGIGFSLDDFGTGYSSLAYLKQLPISQLKIDRTFVHDINTDQNDEIIVETIISMARVLGLEVIAEGVETEAHLKLLEEKGCNKYQGYLFSKPVPVEVFTSKLQKMH